MDRLDAMRLLVRTIERRSFTAAAADLGKRIREAHRGALPASRFDAVIPDCRILEQEKLIAKTVFVVAARHLIVLANIPRLQRRGTQASGVRRRIRAVSQTRPLKHRKIALARTYHFDFAALPRMRDRSDAEQGRNG